MKNLPKTKQIDSMKSDSNDTPSNDGKMEKAGQKLVNLIVDKAIGGARPLCSAEDLAMQYQIDTSYPDDEERIESLINWETSKNFTSGFITGLGGAITLPVAIPGALGASWIIQARMAAAIAIIAGHDIKSDKVRTFVLISLLGNAGKDILKDVGIKVGNGLAKSALEKIPGKVLIEINKRVGFRLVTKAGEKGAVNLIKMVPFAGGVVAGAFDAGACRFVGKTAKNLFLSSKV
jgi:hypothetical protein